GREGPAGVCPRALRVAPPPPPFRRTPDATFFSRPHLNKKGRRGLAPPPAVRVLRAGPPGSGVAGPDLAAGVAGVLPGGRHRAAVAAVGEVPGIDRLVAGPPREEGPPVVHDRGEADLPQLGVDQGD